MSTASSRFTLRGTAAVKHINIRKEGSGDSPDERTLKVDLKLEVRTDMALPDFLDAGLRHFLWTPTGIVRNPMLKAVGFDGEVSDIGGEVCGLQVSGATAHKFAVRPHDSHEATVTMTLTWEPSADDVAVIAEHIGESVELDVQAAPDLLDQRRAA